MNTTDTPSAPLTIEDIGPGRPHIRLLYPDDDVWRDFINLRFAIIRGEDIYEANPVTFRKLARDPTLRTTPSTPMLSICIKGEGNTVMASMMDQLWNLGVRPSDIGTPGHLAATQAHLQDIQLVAQAYGKTTQDLFNFIEKLTLSEFQSIRGSMAALEISQVNAADIIEKVLEREPSASAMQELRDRNTMLEEDLEAARDKVKELEERASRLGKLEAEANGQAASLKRMLDERNDEIVTIVGLLDRSDIGDKTSDSWAARVIDLAESYKASVRQVASVQSLLQSAKSDAQLFQAQRDKEAQDHANTRAWAVQLRDLLISIAEHIDFPKPGIRESDGEPQFTLDYFIALAAAIGVMDVNHLGQRRNAGVSGDEEDHNAELLAAEHNATHNQP